MQRIINYGSFLQAFALKSMLESLGHQVEFVDYHPRKNSFTRVGQIPQSVQYPEAECAFPAPYPISQLQTAVCREISLFSGA